MKKNIVLTGFMGAGKSVIAKKLESILKRRLVSTDGLIVDREKRPITDIFKDSGEDYFRKVESEVVGEISAQEGLIVDCGGGIVLNEDNVVNLKRTGIVFYLSATPEVIYKRVKDQKHRPLLNVDDPLKAIKELLEKRELLYLKADHTINTSDKTIEQVAEEIIKLLPHD